MEYVLQTRALNVLMQTAAYNNWTGLVDWWTDTKIHFMLSNDTHSPVGLRGSPTALFLAK